MNIEIEQSAKFLAELVKTNRSDAVEKAKHERDTLCCRYWLEIDQTASQLAETFSKIAPSNNLAELMRQAILNP